LKSSLTLSPHSKRRKISQYSQAKSRIKLSLHFMLNPNIRPSLKFMINLTILEFWEDQETTLKI
jgi:hypothetical protein